MIFRYIIILMFFISSQALSKDFILGEVWFDNSGNKINAHGGGVIYYEGKYYFVGEFREKGSSLTQKISLYSSSDLSTWQFEGIIFDAANFNSTLNIERPKVIFNKKTNKFVLWFHEEIAGDFNFSKAGVAVSNKINGNYSFVHDFWPNANILPDLSDSKKYNNLGSIIADRKFNARISQGQMVRDMSLFVDDNDRAYLIYTSEDNYSLQIAELSSNYLELNGKYARVMVGQKNEAPTLFKRNGTYYIISSGLHGYSPTISKIAAAKYIFGPWKQYGSPFKSNSLLMVKNSFYSQSTYVLKLNNQDSYIFMADRWKRGSLQDSTYIWLPISWEHDLPNIYWKDKWSLNYFSSLEN